MGKVPTSLRSAIKSPLSSFLRPPPPSSTQQLPSPDSPPPLPRPRPPPSNTRKAQAPRKTLLSIKTSPTTVPRLPRIVPVFESPSLSAARSKFDSLVASALDATSSFDHNAVLQSFCQSGATTRDAVAFLRHMALRSPSFTPNRSSYDVLLVHTCLQPSPGDTSTVLQVFDLMSNAEFHPTPASADIAVRSLCSAGREDDACTVVKELALKYSAPPDQYTYNFLVRHLCKVRVLDTVYEFIDELRNNIGMKPDLVTYTILIDSVCRANNLREASRLLGVLKDGGFKPDCYLYNTIMKGYCSLSHCSDLMNIYNEMKEEGVEPDLVTYNTLIFGLSKAGRVDQATRFLNVMAEMGHFPDTVTYTSLMNGMCRKGDALGALKLLKDMEEKACEPNACTYNTLLIGLCKGGKHLEKGLELYRVMTSAGMKLDAAAYATLVRALIRNNKVAEAYGVFDYALESKSLTDAAAYMSLESSLKWLSKS